MEMDWPMTVAVFAGFVFSIVVHECAHAIVASWLGDDTAKHLGRITLNPLPHIDPFMSILLPLVLWFSTNGSFVFGGAKPVPVNMMNLRRPLRDMMWVALAGPVSNILLALGFALFINLAPGLVKWNPTFTENYLGFLIHVVGLNVILALFNLIPIPPLDGSRVLAYFLPRELAVRVYTYQAQMFGMILIMILSFSGHTQFLVPWMRLVIHAILSVTVFTLPV